MWLFTWKSQMTWQRLAAGAVGLFALPVLVYLTTPSPETWAQSHRLQMGSPAAYLNGYAKRVTRLGIPLQAQQREELTRIFTEEFRRAEDESAQRAVSDLTPESRSEDLEQCYESLLPRVRTVLDARQFSEFEKYQRRHRNQRTAVTAQLGWGRTTPFYHCLIDLYFFIVLPLSCVRTCGALIRDELEADTLSFLTTRPLTRARLLLVKYLSQMAWLQLWLVAQTLLILGAGTFQLVPALGNLLPLLLGAQVLAVLAWCALGLLLGQISKRYMALALLYGFIVELGIGRIPTNINSLSLMRHLQKLLAFNPALQDTFSWPAPAVAGPISALVLATVLFLMGATLLFTYKEYHRTSEMQK